MNQFGRRSKKVHGELHPDLQLILEYAIIHCPIDFGLHEGHRSFDNQLKYFLAGKSRLDPRIADHVKKSKHMKKPSEAVDLHSAEKGTTWHTESLSLIAGFIMAYARVLYDMELITHLIRWGGDWDQDGVILIDQSFDDLPHLELYKPN